jgi:16S rRNA (cytosine967-C5)-methyltransferase
VNKPPSYDTPRKGKRFARKPADATMPVYAYKPGKKAPPKAEAKPAPKPAVIAPPTSAETLAGLPARRAALAMVEAALDRRGGFDEAHGLSLFAKLEGGDRAFARMLASATLRGLGKIDALLDQKLQSPPGDNVRNLLRLGAAQILFDLAPAFAAVSTTLAMAETPAGLARYKGLINAVLRGIDRAGGAELLNSLDASANAPPWLFARWTSAYGAERALAIAEVISQTPATDITVKSAEDTSRITEALEGQVLATGSIRTERRGDLTEWPEFADGTWWVQDAAAAIPTRLLQVQPGEAALDLCAAPGGKTMQLAAAGAEVTAVDRSATRLKRVAENLARVKLEAKLITADAASLPADTQYDAVLLDAPCSATGTFRRQPDVLWGATPMDIIKLAGVQSRLLDKAADLTKPQGRLVYCVCSLEPEEGEAQIAAFLQRHPNFQRGPIDPAHFGLTAAAMTPDGDIRLLPAPADDTPAGGQDGFFAALLTRI